MSATLVGSLAPPASEGKVSAATLEPQPIACAWGSPPSSLHGEPKKENEHFRRGGQKTRPTFQVVALSFERETFEAPGGGGEVQLTPHETRHVSAAARQSSVRPHPASSPEGYAESSPRESSEDSSRGNETPNPPKHTTHLAAP